MKQKKPVESDLQDRVAKNGESIQRRTAALIEKAGQNDGSFNIEVARSLGVLEGKTTLISDLLVKDVVPTLRVHAEKIEKNVWWTRGAIVLQLGIAGGLWWLGRFLVEYFMNR